MTIGFFDNSLELLNCMKSAAHDFSEHSYVIYADTLNAPYTDKSQVDLTRYIDQALAYLIAQGCTTIVLGKAIPVALLQNNKRSEEASFTIVDPDMLSDYLEVVPISASTLDSTDVKRIIHLTKHSSETDAQIARILNGHFIVHDS